MFEGQKATVSVVQNVFFSSSVQSLRDLQLFVSWFSSFWGSMQLRFLLRFPFELTCESRDGVGVGGRAGGDLRRPEVFVDKVHSARKLRRL